MVDRPEPRIRKGSLLKCPLFRVRLLQTTRLLPQQSVLTRGEVIGSALPDDDATLLVEPSEQVDEKPGVVLEPTITMK